METDSGKGNEIRLRGKKEHDWTNHFLITKMKSIGIDKSPR